MLRCSVTIIRNWKLVFGFFLLGNKLCDCAIFTPFLAEDDKNNQFLQSDDTSQKLSRDEIMNLKAQGVSGKV